MKNFVFFTSVYDEEARRYAATKVLTEFRKKASVEGYMIWQQECVCLLMFHKNEGF